MRCDQAKLELHSYQCGQLSLEQRATLEIHLSSCQACSEEASEMKSLGDMISRSLKDWVEQGVCPPELSARIEVSLRPSPKKSWWRGWQIPVGAMTAAAAVFLLLLGTRPEFNEQMGSIPLIGALAAQMYSPDFQVNKDGLSAQEALVLRSERVARLNATYELYGVTLTVHKLEVSSNGTRVQYSLRGVTLDKDTTASIFEPQLTGQDGVVRLLSYNGDQRKREVVFNAYFDPVAPNQTLTLTLNRISLFKDETVRWQLGTKRATSPTGPGAAVVAWTQHANSATVTVQWPRQEAVRLSRWAAAGADGKPYTVREIRGPSSTSQGMVSQQLVIDVPEGIVPLTLSAGRIEREQEGPWQVTFQN